MSNFVANNFIIKEKDEFSSKIELNLSAFEIENNNNYDLIVTNTKGKTQNIGEPELPTYTFNYAKFIIIDMLAK